MPDTLFGISGAIRQEVSLPAGYKGGRLTLTSGTPVTTADVTGATTLYYTPCPFASNEIAFPTSSRDGGRWFRKQFSEAKMLLTGLTASKPYDVFAEPGSNNISLYVGPAWTSATARAVDLSYVDAVPVHRGNERAVYLGTIYVNSTGGQTDDSATKRFVWNVSNRVLRQLQVVEETDTWTYTTATYRQANANTANRVDLVVGLQLSVMNLEVRARAINTVGANISVSISTGTNVASISTTAISGVVGQRAAALVGLGPPAIAKLVTHPAVGFQYYAWIEQSVATGVTTWSGDQADSSISQSGMVGFIDA